MYGITAKLRTKAVMHVEKSASVWKSRAGEKGWSSGKVVEWQGERPRLAVEGAEVGKRNAEGE